MPVKKIHFNNFKNLTSEFELNPHINVIIGPNGRGKTNFLEGIYFLSFGSGFRDVGDTQIVNWNSKFGFYSITSDLNDNDEVQLVLKYGNTVSGGGKKTFQVNEIGRNKKIFIGHISAVLFAPDSVNLVSGPPEARRKIIDDVLSLLDPLYGEIINEYKKILRQRNKLLQSDAPRFEIAKQLNFWNKGLIDNGSYIVAKRIDFLNQISGPVSEKANNLFSGEVRGLNIKYISKFYDGMTLTMDDFETIRAKVKEALDQKFNANIDKEIAVGKTLYGPHREDFEFRLNEMLLRESGSRGQQRLASLIFSLAVFDIFNDKEDTTAILLLDDVMSELDEFHRANIEKLLLALKGQIVITSADEKNFTAQFLERIFRIDF